MSVIAAVMASSLVVWVESATENVRVPEPRSIFPEIVAVPGLVPDAVLYVTAVEPPRVRVPEPVLRRFAEPAAAAVPPNKTLLTVALKPAKSIVAVVEVPTVLIFNTLVAAIV